MTRFGYLIRTREAVMGGTPAATPLLELATRAENAGYESVWVGDALLARPRHDPLTLLAAGSAGTENVALGTAVLLPVYRNPVVLAQQLAPLDRVSAGRLVVGVGIAADRPNIRAEFEAAGAPFERRGGRLLEGLRLMRALWRGDAVDWDGRWTLRDAVLGPLPHRPGGPPVWGAWSHPTALARAGRSMDGGCRSGPTTARSGGACSTTSATMPAPAGELDRRARIISPVSSTTILRWP